MKTDVHFPTNLNLLYDALRIVIRSCVRWSKQYPLPRWRQHEYNLRKFKKQSRKLQKMKHSTYTEWISKGKAGVPVELGLRVCILEDRSRFILHSRVMQKTTDDKVAVEMVQAAQARFPDLNTVSFDKGFHSPSNQQELKELLDLVVLPKKGKNSKAEREREAAPEFQAARRQHSADESAINALEVHGLDTCPGHGIEAFERYVSLALFSRNIQQLGAILRRQERQRLEEQRKKAA